ncbi:hypothetical protein [Sandarakinorhabdus sp.]|uniref:hypothetical protein n=1 Tax=Sandarakinorhabdus sp. TaxID=1916663 RepID=UPI00286D995F|nr:hypothetical protein [Sandarakinorhabdus sp.]
MATAAYGQIAQTRSRFHFRMALVFIAMAFAGFAPTYWVPVAAGRFGGAPIMHVHGALFFAWTLFYLNQTWLVTSGATANHRRNGMIGAMLFGAMLMIIPVTAINSMWQAERNFGPEGLEAARRFTAVPLMSMLVMAGLFSAAMLNVHRSDIHKRLLLVLNAGMLQAAMGRPFAAMAAANGAVGPPPAIVTLMPAVIVDMLIVAGMVHDKRTTGRVHMAYVVGLGVTVALQIGMVAIASTDGWLAFATWLQHLVR